MYAIERRRFIFGVKMEGRGTTNYAVKKPSFGFSTATTEFDDILISKGIVTHEQAMIAKGATPNEARRLAEINASENSVTQLELHIDDDKQSNNSDNIQDLGDGHDDESLEDENDDEQFIKTYRQMRINEMKTGRQSEYGDVVPISRPDWNREVNEASKHNWVIVNLTRSSSSLSITHDETCDKVEEAMRDLADKFVNVKFVSIPSTSAIENWPANNLPTIFCYRYEKMQHQLVGVDSMGGPGVNSARLEWRLAVLGVVQTDLEDDPRPDRVSVSEHISSGRKSHFEGTMSRLGTRRDHDSDDDSYDDVD